MIGSFRFKELWKKVHWQHQPGRSSHALDCRAQSRVSLSSLTRRWDLCTVLNPQPPLGHDDAVDKKRVVSRALGAPVQLRDGDYLGW